MYILTSGDLFLTFDPVMIIDFSSCLINALKMQQVPLKSVHVLHFCPVKFIDLYWPVWDVSPLSLNTLYEGWIGGSCDQLLKPYHVICRRSSV